MPKLIKDGKLVDNTWQLITEKDALPDGNILVPLSTWNSHQEAIADRKSEVGPWLESDDLPSDIQGNLNDIPVIAVNFPAFADGRGFSIARLLRERLNYTGEIRAIGQPIRDQLTYLFRCGFNAVDLADHYDAESALASLNDFSENYQVSVEQKVPLFKRRA